MPEWIRNNPAIVIAAMICATILIYGMMQMWCANGQRYEYHSWQGYIDVFDKREGVVYRGSTITDYVNRKSIKSEMERKK